MKLSAIMIASVMAALSTAAITGISAADTKPKVYVDKNGVMRNTSDNTESAYYGTNYTLPFAHAYRAVKKSGGDFHEIIDRDVYHFKRLGLNAFRLHLWDAELADSAGNLLDNEHLALLDYLLSALEREGIDIILTAQTNFGNGYPEKNIDTGAFTYDFDKCRIHDDPKAQEIQENYLTQLVEHVNPYTGKSYGKDPDIVGIEINNEPCHSGSRKEVTAYIDRMSDALRKGGYEGVILYNVSHNPDVTAAYYDARDVQGTTYQWYPDGLVAGHERKGNLLPYVDDYNIPWSDTIPGYDRMARVVYEFDPGDVLTSYLYPAIARTFRKEGFQWATQFAYDPTPLAPYNTEYQTHYLNLLYTPSKALSMAIAAEVMKETPRGKDYGRFPTDTVFGNFRLSPAADLSEYSTPETFIHTNTTTSKPRDVKKLTRVAGVGSSPVVKYSGTGAYFLDRLEPGVWRLEILPDLVRTADPFEKPAPGRTAGWLDYKPHAISIKLPALGENFAYRAINSDNDRTGTATGDTFEAYPGTYLLYQPRNTAKAASLLTGQIADQLRRYAAPGPVEIPDDSPAALLRHTAPKHTAKGEPMRITASAIPMRAERIDSVVVFPSDISFWNDTNPSFRMTDNGNGEYSAEIPAEYTDRAQFDYMITVFTPGEKRTYPADVSGEPLDWDYLNYDYYSVNPVTADEEVALMTATRPDPALDISTVPATWTWRSWVEPETSTSREALRIINTPEEDGMLIVSRYVADDLKGVPCLDRRGKVIVALRGEVPATGELALVDTEGVTRSIPFAAAESTKAGDMTYLTFSLADATPRTTVIAPAPFPTFLARESTPADMGAIKKGAHAATTEFLQLLMPQKAGENSSVEITGIWSAPVSAE